MLKRLLETVRKYPLLRTMLFFHGAFIAVLVGLYYAQADTMLWGAVLSVPVMRKADGGWIYQHVARGPSLALPWHLLPQHVFWVGLNMLVFGSLTIWWTWWMMGDELRQQVASREKAAADKLLEAEERNAAADLRMREAEAWEQRLKALESRLEARESEAGDRELAAQAHVEKKDAEVKKMNQALTRLKTEVRRLREDS